MTITAVAAVWPSSEDGPAAGVVGGVGGATWTGATWGGVLSGTAAADCDCCCCPLIRVLVDIYCWVDVY